MREAQTPGHVSLNTLIAHLREGRFVIPDFQREFEWEPWDIKELMRSIFQDYYIGSLLLWKGKRANFDSLSCEVIYGFDDRVGQLPWDYGNGNPEHIVLDGQQRLTALYYAFVAPNVPLPNRVNRAVYFIHVDKFIRGDADEAFQYDWLSRRFSRVLDSVETQYAEHIFPLSVVGADGWALPNWVQGYEQFWKNALSEAEDNGDAGAADTAARHAASAAAFGVHLEGITQEYQISFIELDKELAVDKVCDIFTQINSRGIRLDVFDLINALLKPKGLQLKHLWRKASTRLEFVDTGKMNVYVLQVMSILRQSYCSPKYLYYLLPGQSKQIRTADGDLEKEILIQDAADFEARWAQAVDALESAIDLLRHPQEFGATSSRYLPYVSILPVFSALQFSCNSLAASERLDAQRKIRHWYWAAVFTNRYSGSVESTSARDFQDVKAWIQDDDAEPALLQEFESRFRSMELRKETKKGTSVYNGIFNLFVLQGARDWMTGNIPQHGDLDDHHIVPASWGKANLKDGSIHTILNRTPLTADTNRHAIGDRLPNEYLPELIAASSERQVRAVLESHFISPLAQEILLRDPFGPDDYQEFIAERQRTLLGAIEDLLIKERLDLSLPLRELDQEVETVELELRRLVADELDDEASQLPPHLTQKLAERIQVAARRNAAIDAENYKVLGSMLQYADLRDLQDAICSKATWAKFEERFVSKESLNVKFGQLAELRNGIRHSRNVDDVTRMEGDAAVRWFHRVLNK